MLVLLMLMFVERSLAGWGQDAGRQVKVSLVTSYFTGLASMLVSL